MTQEITDIIERNLLNLFDELDELAWHDGEYNPYIVEDVLCELLDVGLYDAYVDYIDAGESREPDYMEAADLNPHYWLDCDGDRWDVVEGGLRLIADPNSRIMDKEEVEEVWGPLTPGYEIGFQVDVENEQMLYELFFGE